MDLSQKSDAEILSIANPIMDNLMEASTAINYERHIRDFTARLKSVLSKERLEWICRTTKAQRDSSPNGSSSLPFGGLSLSPWSGGKASPSSQGSLWRRWS